MNRGGIIKKCCYASNSGENWGFVGNSIGFEATYAIGPVAMTHAIQDPKGWRLLISEGELLDTSSLKINETALVVKVEKPMKQYFEELMHYGFSHHSIAVPGKVGKQLEYQIVDRANFKRFLGLKKSDKVPDSKTFWLFREQLIEKDVIMGLFKCFNETLDEAGVFVNEGKMVDACFVEVPRQRNTREEQGKIYRSKNRDG